MKTNWLVGSVFLAGAMVLRAQTNDLNAALRQGLFEEEANRNLDAAITNYQALAAQFDQDRPVAATAIFRLGECYRRLGRTNDAMIQYQRIIQEFSDQTSLVNLSRQNLTALHVAMPPQTWVAPPLPAPTGTFQQRLQAIIQKAPQDSMAAVTDDEEKEIRRIQQLIQNSPDLINAKSWTRGAESPPPLMFAAGAGQLKVATFLLDHGADINLQRDGSDYYAGWTALHYAADAGNRAMVELLLSRGADVTVKANDGQTPLFVAVGKNFQAVTEVLLTNRAEVNLSEKNNGDTPLHLAAKNGRAKIIQLLLATGANPAAENNAGRTPLSFAAGSGSPEAVKTLLAAKADPNGGKIDAPLLAAIHKQDVASAELLLQAGANPNAKTMVNWALSFGFSSYPNGLALSPMYLALLTDQLPMVGLLLKFKADPNESQTDGSPILFSALDKPEILEALLNAGGRVDSHLANGQTLLGLAVNRNNAAAAEILMKHEANPNALSQEGFTPLHYAIYGSADSHIFVLLLDHHADPNVRDNYYGQTPLDAVKSKLASDATPGMKAYAGPIADLLRQHGALDNLPHWDGIEISRPSANYIRTVFKKGTNDWNHFTLLETVLNFYQPQPPFSGLRQGFELPFPDLTRVMVVHHRRGTTNETRMTVNLLDGTNGVDCSKDMPLEFGDVVVIAEREHALGDNPIGLTMDQRGTISNCRKGTIVLMVRDRKTELPVYPYPSSVIGPFLGGQEARKTLLSSSDLSRVKVTRPDSKTGKKHEWVLDCSGNNAPDLWLRDGDVIEVPEK